MTETFEYLSFGSIEEFRFRTEIQCILYTAHQTKGGRYDYKKCQPKCQLLYLSDNLFGIKL